MIPVHDLFEVHLTVHDLDRAIAFYRDALGLRLAHVITERRVAFFWIGPAGHAMLGLWTAGSAPQKVTLHTAFRVSLADVIAAPQALRAVGIVPLDFDDRPTDQPIVFAWMPAASVFLMVIFAAANDELAIVIATSRSAAVRKRFCIISAPPSARELPRRS